MHWKCNDGHSVTSQRVEINYDGAAVDEIFLQELKKLKQAISWLEQIL